MAEYLTCILIWFMVIWLVWLAIISIKIKALVWPGFVNVVLAAVFINAIACLLGLRVSGILPYDFSANQVAGHEGVMDGIVLIFVDEFLSWILLLVSLFLIALRIKR